MPHLASKRSPAEARLRLRYRWRGENITRKHRNARGISQPFRLVDWRCGPRVSLGTKSTKMCNGIKNACRDERLSLGGRKKQLFLTVDDRASFEENGRHTRCSQNDELVIPVDANRGVHERSPPRAHHPRGVVRRVAEPARLQFTAKHAGEDEARRIVSVACGHEEGVATKAVAEGVLLRFEFPLFLEELGDGIVVDGKQQVGTERIGCSHPLEQALARGSKGIEQDRFREPTRVERLLDFLGKEKVELVLGHAARAGGARGIEAVTDIDEQRENCRGHSVSAPPYEPRPPARIRWQLQQRRRDAMQQTMYAATFAVRFPRNVDARWCSLTAAKARSVTTSWSRHGDGPNCGSATGAVGTLHVTAQVDD